MEYSTGMVGVSQLPQKLERQNLSGNPLIFVTQKLGVEPIIKGKVNSQFFFGADREPALDWQKTVTTDLKAARGDLNNWFANGSKGSLPLSVELIKARYNAVMTVMFTFSAGGNFFSDGDAGQKVEVWHGVIAIEAANRTMEKVLQKMGGTENKNFLKLRESIITSFLKINLVTFQDQKEWLDHFYSQIDKSQTVLLNVSKGLQVGSDIYISEAGKQESWKKTSGGATAYSSNTVNGKEYSLTVKSSKGISSDFAEDLKLTSDLNESMGTKITQGANVSTPGQ